MQRTWFLALGGGLTAVFLMTGCQQQSPAPSPVEISLEGVPARVTGPHAFKNLAVYLLCSSTQEERDFLTLDEGLTQGLVKVTEQENEQVNGLLLDNQSDRPLYLQEGERLQGGKQDRTIIASLVVVPHSGPRTVPTFCVERSRWTEGVDGRKFNAVANLALAPKGVRGAAKIEGNQGGVWHCVGVQKRTASTVLKAANTNSSINETFDAPEAQKVSDEYAGALVAILAQHPDAVGVVVCVNGVFEEANVYPNHALLAKFCPRLVRSYAIQAVMLGENTDVSPPSASEIARLLQGGAERSVQNREIDASNKLQVRERDGHQFVCVTRHDGKVIHWQILARNGESGDKEMDGRRAASLGSSW